MKPEHYAQLTDDEKARYHAHQEFVKKIQALEDSILAECRKQGLTVEEFQLLLGRLYSVAGNRQKQVLTREPI